MKTYVVTIGGIEHTVQLDADEAKRLGAREDTGKASTKAKQPANKSSTPDQTK